MAVLGQRALAAPSVVPLATLYGSFLAAFGVYGPFLAVYLPSRGFTPSAAAYLLAALPIAQVVATPLWTLAADRAGSAAVVLRVISVGALLAFAALQVRAGCALIAVVLLVFTVFRAPGGALIDVLALAWAGRTGGHFGRVRAWGTIGYATGALATGVAVRRFGASVLVPLTLAMLGLTLAATLRLPRAAPPPPTPLLPGLLALARRPRIVLFMATAGLHQIGLAAYDWLFPARLTALAGAQYAGAAIALGTAAEVLVMTFAHRLMARWGIARTLALAYAGSAVRWLILALVVDPWVLIGAQALHGLTFGAFYTAGVALIDAESPPEVRASAQGMFATLVWGLAASIALTFAGWLQPRGGMSAVFLAATAASVLATFMAFRLGPDAPAHRAVAQDG